MSCWTKRCGSRRYTRPRYAASRPTNVKTVETETSAAFCNRAFIKSTSDQGQRHVTFDNLRVQAASERPFPFEAYPCATGASRPLYAMLICVILGWSSLASQAVRQGREIEARSASSCCERPVRLRAARNMQPVISTIVISRFFTWRRFASTSAYFTDRLTPPTGLDLLASPSRRASSRSGSARLRSEERRVGQDGRIG